MYGGMRRASDEDKLSISDLKHLALEQKDNNLAIFLVYSPWEMIGLDILEDVLLALNTSWRRKQCSVGVPGTAGATSKRFAANVGQGAANSDILVPLHRSHRHSWDSWRLPVSTLHSNTLDCRVQQSYSLTVY